MRVWCVVWGLHITLKHRKHPEVRKDHRTARANGLRTPRPVLVWLVLELTGRGCTRLVESRIESEVSCVCMHMIK